MRGGWLGLMVEVGIAEVGLQIVAAYASTRLGLIRRFKSVASPLCLLLMVIGEAGLGRRLIANVGARRGRPTSDRAQRFTLVALDFRGISATPPLQIEVLFDRFIKKTHPEKTTRR